MDSPKTTANPALMPPSEHVPLAPNMPSLSPLPSSFSDSGLTEYEGESSNCASDIDLPQEKNLKDPLIHLNEQHSEPEEEPLLRNPPTLLQLFPPSSETMGERAPARPPVRAPARAPEPRTITNAVYDPAYEAMGLPVDPHLRMLMKYLKNRSSQ